MHFIKLSLPFVLSALVAAQSPESLNFPRADQLFSRQDKPGQFTADGKFDLVKMANEAAIEPTNQPPALPPLQETTSDDKSITDVMNETGLSTALASNVKRSSKRKCKVYIPSTRRNKECKQNLSFNGWKHWNYPNKCARDNRKKCGKGNKYNPVYTDRETCYRNPKANTFLGQTTHEKYEPNVCADRCDAMKGCWSFDIYFERTPVTDPTAYGALSNPPMGTQIVCSYHGAPINQGCATDGGHNIGKCQIVKKGCNGYVKPPMPCPPVVNWTGGIGKGGLDNRIATGEGHLVGPEYAHYNKYLVLHTSILTTVPYFHPEHCKAISETIPGAQSFDTWPLLVGGDDKSSPYKGAGGRYAGQGCIIFSEKNFNPVLFNDEGQYGRDEVTGNDNAFFSHSPLYHFDKN